MSALESAATICLREQALPEGPTKPPARAGTSRPARPARLSLARPRPASRFCEVGWLVDTEKSALIYGPPRALGRRPEPETPAAAAPNPKSVTRCPALIDLETKTFEVPCPVDITLRLVQDDKGRLRVAPSGDGQASINRQHLAQMVFLLQRERWRDPRYPVVQIAAPYRFVADEPVWLSQLPPYDHWRETPWPGLLIGGRFPIDVWPRSLMWALEWRDTAKPLVIRRGEPWFYLRFETLDPARPVRLLEAEMTEALRRHCNGLDGVTNYVGQTFQLFAEARARRPARLLTKAARPNRRD